MSDPHAPGLLFIVNSLEMGGAEKQVVTLINHLDAGRFRLHLAYLKPAARLLPQLHIERLDELLCCEAGRGLQARALRRLRELLDRHVIDAIICTNTYSLLYGSLARASLNRPGPKLAAVFHSTILKTYKERTGMLLYRQLFKRSDLLLYVSEKQRLFWRKHGLTAGAEAVVHNGIDLDHFSDHQTASQKLALRRELGFDPDDYVIGLCSALRPEKRHGDLVAALAQLRAQGIPAKALLIGDGPRRAAIERLVLAHGLSGHVYITGMQQDVRPYIACCDVMTLASDSETFSLAALESMALGKPLVLTDTGGASEQVIDGHNGFLYAPGDVPSLARHLKTLQSPELRAQLGQAGLTRVRRLFSVKTMTAGFCAQITRMLS